MQKLNKEYLFDLVDLQFLRNLNRIGINTVKSGPKKTAFLANFKSTKVIEEDMSERSALLMYFLEANGEWFRAFYKFEPYFYLQCIEEYTK